MLFTESPYDHAHEARIAGLVDGCWTHERTVLEAFRAINPEAWYLRHGWHPDRHFVSTPAVDVRAHDVVFVGSGFPERVRFFNSIDWTGIDLGLYGIWDGLGLKDQVQACVRSGPIDNVQACAVYRRAKIGLNLYRKAPAASLNPRAYELAACGVFSISEARAESADVFGDVVPTFETPQEAEALIRQWLADEAGRALVQEVLPVAVANDSWVVRAGQVLSDMASAAHRHVSADLTLPGSARFFGGAPATRQTVPPQAFPQLHWWQDGGRA